MKIIFFLRSYGDYIVALNRLIKADSADPFSLVLSSHLRPLHEAIIPFFPRLLLHVEFVDFGIQHGLLSCFTNRYLCSLNAIKELLRIRSFIKNKYNALTTPNEFYLEQYKRAGWVNLFTGTSFKIIHNNKQTNIYDAYDCFFQVKKEQYNNTDIPLNADSKIVVFPDSRLEKKKLPMTLLHQLVIMMEKNALQPKIALFRNNNTGFNKQAIVYDNFSTLVELINQANFIITADSLVAHLSQLFHKPHYIFYPAKINQEWITPFAQQFNFAANFYETEPVYTILKNSLVK